MIQPSIKQSRYGNGDNDDDEEDDEEESITPDEDEDAWFWLRKEIINEKTKWVFILHLNNMCTLNLQ